MRPLYLDCAATCPVDPSVADTVMRYMVEDYGNASSRHHGFGTHAAAAVSEARAIIAGIAKASPEDVIFTSGATEANNLALLGLASSGLESGRTHILSTAIEHPSVLQPLRRLEKLGYEIEFAPPSVYGRVSTEWFSDHIRPETFLVSIMHVNNETGAIQPISEICSILEGHDAWLHVDGTQSFGKLNGLEHPRIDFLSCSAHKICGPKGVGALISKRRNGASPLIARQFGGGQERELRSGTLPVELIAGFGKAADIVSANREEFSKHAAAMKYAIRSSLQELKVYDNAPPEQSSPYILNVSLQGIDSEAFIIATKDLVAVSNGSACSSHTMKNSHVLEAMSLPNDRISSAIRFSWCHLTPQIDTTMLAKRVAALV